MKHLLSYTAVIFLFFLFGCSGSESSSNRRGKLSDAMEASSDDNSGERKVNADFREPDPAPAYSPIEDKSHVDPSVSQFRDTVGSPKDRYVPSGQTKQEYLDSVYRAENDNDDNVVSSDRKPHQGYSVGVYAGSGIVSSNEMYGLSSFGIEYSTLIDRRYRADINAGLSIAPIQETGSLSRSIDGGIGIFEIKVQVRFPVTPNYTWIGQYFLIGGGMNYMLWKYRNPFSAPVYNSFGIQSGQETISSDMMKGIDLFCGLGMDLSQNLPLHIVGEVRPGIILWTGTTEEGFENDVFPNFAYLQFLFRCSFGSR
jgi:hypothetical protein